MKHGWEPLCEYLGVPVPEGIPFPHVHTRAKLEGEMFILRVINWIWPLAFLVAPWAACWKLVQQIKKWRRSMLASIGKSDREYLL